MKKVIFSGIQPSGNLHIGNYIGAIAQWIKLQNEAEAFFCIVDLHAITVPQDSKALKEKVLDAAALYIACGIDPKKSHIFVQSENPDHPYLAWILNTITSMGQIRRTTQYKEKSGIKKFEELYQNLRNTVKDRTEINKKWMSLVDKNLKNKGMNLDMAKKLMVEYREYLRQSNEMLLPNLGYAEGKEALEEKSSVGLFDYPVLMAADILLYQTDEVPVGEDQKQHIEITRDLAEKFNSRFGQTFRIPILLIQKETARIMSLADPISKMSKSANDPMGTINLLDDEDSISEKITKAVTDSGSEIKYGDDKPAISNLLTIYSVFSGESPIEAEASFKGKTYSEFKEELTKVVNKKLKAIREEYQRIRSDEKALREILDEGAEYARSKSFQTLKEVKEKMGLS